MQSLTLLKGSAPNCAEALLPGASLARIDSVQPICSLQDLHSKWLANGGDITAEKCVAHARQHDIHPDWVRQVYAALANLKLSGGQFARLQSGNQPIPVPSSDCLLDQHSPGPLWIVE